MSATLTLVRESVLMELRRGIFDVVIDGQKAGTVEAHRTTTIQVEPGRHTVRMSEGRYSSSQHDFDVADNEVVTFRCSGARIWPIYLASFVKPDLALTLTRVDGSR